MKGFLMCAAVVEVNGAKLLPSVDTLRFEKELLNVALMACSSGALKVRSRPTVW